MENIKYVTWKSEFLIFLISTDEETQIRVILAGNFKTGMTKIDADSWNSSFKKVWLNITRINKAIVLFEILIKF